MLHTSPDNKAVTRRDSVMTVIRGNTLSDSLAVVPGCFILFSFFSAFVCVYDLLMMLSEKRHVWITDFVN